MLETIFQISWIVKKGRNCFIPKGIMTGKPWCGCKQQTVGRVVNHKASLGLVIASNSNGNFAFGDFTVKPFSLTWRQAPLSKFPLRFPSISSVLSIATSVRKCRAKELLLATCLSREKRITVIAPLGNPRKGYLSILFQALSMNKQNILPFVKATWFLFFNTTEKYY